MAFRRLTAAVGVGLALAVVLLGVGTQRASYAARPDFVGADACGTCHPDELAAWNKTGHSGASETLGKSVTSRRCLRCHSTGDAPAGRPYYSGVGCESCHGPGAGYSPADIMRDPALASAVGLRQLSTPELRRALCAECHRASTRLKPFDPERAWQKIRH